MGARGPKPAAHNIVALNAVQARRLPPPKILRPAAAKVWRETVGTKPEGYFTDSDVPTLEAYCMQVSIHRQAYDAMFETIEDAPALIDTGEKPRRLTPTLTSRTKNGYDSPNSNLQLLNDAQRMVAALSVKLRLNANAKPDKAERAARRSGSKRDGLLFSGE